MSKPGQLTTPEIVFRRTLGGGMALHVRGQELIYIPRTEVEKLQTMEQILGDLHRRLRPLRDKGAIRDDEFAFILWAAGDKLTQAHATDEDY